MRHRLAYLKGVPLPSNEFDTDATLYDDLQCLITDLALQVENHPEGRVSVHYVSDLVRFTWKNSTVVRRRDGAFVYLDQEYWYDISVIDADETSGVNKDIGWYISTVLIKELNNRARRCAVAS